MGAGRCRLATQRPWLTSFVDADTTKPGRMLGLAPGRSGACVRDRLNQQSLTFQAAIEIVVIDTSAPYASGIRMALPHAKIAVDKWHLVALANQMLTEVRQRVTREQLGRRGTTKEKAWLNRHLLLTGYEHLSDKQRKRLDDALAVEDPTGETAAAWAVKERLRLLLVGFMSADGRGRVHVACVRPGLAAASANSRMKDRACIQSAI